MHSFVLSFLKEVVDPAVVAFKCPQTAQMTMHPTNHSWDASHCLQEDSSVHPVSLVHFLGVIPRNQVKPTSRRLDRPVGKFVFDSSRFSVCELNILDIFKLVDRMGHSVGLGVQD